MIRNLELTYTTEVTKILSKCPPDASRVFYFGIFWHPPPCSRDWVGVMSWGYPPQHMGECARPYIVGGIHQQTWRIISTGTMLPPTAYGGMRITRHCGRHPSTDVADCGKRATSSMLRSARSCSFDRGCTNGESCMARGFNHVCNAFVLQTLVYASNGESCTLKHKFDEHAFRPRALIAEGLRQCMAWGCPAHTMQT